MNMKKMTHEHISAFADAELADKEITAVLSSLRVPEQRDAWDIYHRIGDILRSEDLAYEMRLEAQVMMAALLDAEPIVFAPIQSGTRPPSPLNDIERGAERLDFEQTKPVFIRTAKHFFRPGMAVAATAAAVAFFAAPPLMVAFNGWRSEDVSHMASSGSPVMAAVENGNIKLKVRTASQNTVADAVDAGSSNMDEYLFAHQRFSRSGYSNAQYASPVSFTTESAK